jgi:plastocyanin
VSEARRHPVVLGAVVVAVLGIAGVAVGAGVEAPAPSVRHEVQMRAVSFAPRELTIHLGDTVLFKNADIVRHNAVRREVFDTGELKAGESYSWIPADTGSYRYQCTIHTRMRGEVKVVRE